MWKKYDEDPVMQWCQYGIAVALALMVALVTGVAKAQAPAYVPYTVDMATQQALFNALENCKGTPWCQANAGIEAGLNDLEAKAIAADAAKKKDDKGNIPPTVEVKP